MSGAAKNGLIPLNVEASDAGGKAGSDVARRLADAEETVASLTRQRDELESNNSFVAHVDEIINFPKGSRAGIWAPLKAHGFDDASVADVFAAAKATPGKGISRSAFAKLLRLGAIHGASTRGESHKARSLLGHSLDLTGDSPELGVHLKAVFDHEPAAKKTELEQRLDVLNISATGVRVLAPRTKQAKTKCGGKHYYRPKPVSLTRGHFALSVRQAQIASIERQIEAAIKGGTDTTALEATYLARVEIARDEHRAAAVDLRRRGGRVPRRQEHSRRVASARSASGSAPSGT